MIIAAQSSKGRGPAANNRSFVTVRFPEGKRMKQMKSLGSTLVWEITVMLRG
jgi:hypothetical protein